MGQRIISTDKRQVPRQNKSQTKTFTPKQSVRTQYSNTTNRQKRMGKGKGKAQRSQPKTITAVQAMKQEMLRRAHEAAAKYVDASVAFCPADEEWMPCSIYPDVGSAFLLGVVARYNITSTKTSDGISVPTATFELHWTSTAFQSKRHVHVISETDLVRGIRQFAKVQKTNLQFGESWESLCSMVPQLSNIPTMTDEFEELDEQGYREWSAFRSRNELQIPLSPGEAEQIESMTFSRTASLGQPVGLFTHADGTSTSKLHEESLQYFGHSATSAFLHLFHLFSNEYAAVSKNPSPKEIELDELMKFLGILWYMTLFDKGEMRNYWTDCEEATIFPGGLFSNEYAAVSKNPSPKEIELDELMKFLGILWYMTLFDKGEMRNYWTDCEEATIFPGGRSTSLDTIMTWRRFLYIRQNLCFRSKVTTADIERDPAARIRPLISILKSRCFRHLNSMKQVLPVDLGMRGIFSSTNP
ncbi:Transposase [Phytophthora palmivora]|uniref:Transposase n=1 Tax=Phytophthora palmivora TaxID=4796 RepID=A0A2P4XQP3_9STRA|nr:Transposase [Phytophthora palmivora]